MGLRNVKQFSDDRYRRLVPRRIRTRHDFRGKALSVTLTLDWLTRFIGDALSEERESMAVDSSRIISHPRRGCPPGRSVRTWLPIETVTAASNRPPQSDVKHDCLQKHTGETRLKNERDRLTRETIPRRDTFFSLFSQHRYSRKIVKSPDYTHTGLCRF